MCVGRGDLGAVRARFEVGGQLVPPQVHGPVGDAAAVDQLLGDGVRVGPLGADQLVLALHLLGAGGLPGRAAVERDLHRGTGGAHPEVGGEPGLPGQVLAGHHVRVAQLGRGALRVVVPRLPLGVPVAVGGGVETQLGLDAVALAGHRVPFRERVAPDVEREQAGPAAVAPDRDGVTVLGQLAGVPVTGDRARGDVRERQPFDAEEVLPALHEVAGAHVLDRVGVPGDGDGLPAFEQVVDLADLVDLVDGAALVGEGQQRDVPGEHDQLVVVDGGQVPLQPGELVLVQPAVVTRGVLRVVALGAPAVGVVDVGGAGVAHGVQRHDVHVADVVGVVGGRHPGAERVEGVLGRGGVEVEVVVAGQEPGRAVGQARQVLDVRVERQVVADDVADEEGAAPLVVAAFRQVVDRAAAGVLDLGPVVGLEVARDDAVLLLCPGELAAHEGEVDRVRQGPGGRDAAVAQFGRALGQVVVVELGDVGLVHRHLVARRLGDEHRHVVVDGQPVAAVPVGRHDVTAVGHDDAGQAALPAVAGAVAVPVDEDPAGQVVGVGRPFRGADDLDLAAVGGLVPGLGRRARRGGGRGGDRRDPSGDREGREGRQGDAEAAVFSRGETQHAGVLR